MPALWQSSQRPMYIRTVWVDGFRHAILTHDDPHFVRLARRRPFSSASSKRRLSTYDDRIDELRQFDFVIRSHKPHDTDRVEHIADIEKLNLVETSEDDNEDDVSRDFGADEKIKIDWNNMRANKTTRTARNEAKENTDLSDRVLQWLDLAGKVDLLATNTDTPQPRHSWPETHRRDLVKSKTATELRPREIKTETKTSANIDRLEVYLPSANTIENYAKQSRKTVTQRDKRDNKKVNLKMNIIEARQKIATEKNAIEKQYTELINKKQIPDLKTRKQVHIFMPEAISKKAGSNLTSRTESLISQAQ